MKKRMLSILFVLAMVLTLLSVAAYAADPAVEVTIGETTTPYETFQAAWDVVKNNTTDPFTIKLLADVTLTESLQIQANMTCTLDLNGFTLRQNANVTSPFDIYGNLTITDTSGAQTGVVTSEAVYAGKTPSIQEASSGFICVRGGSFTLEGGTITGIQVAEGKQHSVVYLKSTSTPFPLFTMNGGKITGNQCTAVCVANGSKFVMNDGEISQNVSNSPGGGVFSRWGTVEINGGAITGNQAKKSVSALYSDSGAGGGIAEVTNSSTTVGGVALSAANSGVTLNGSVNISGNKGPNGEADDITVNGMQLSMDPERFKGYAITLGDNFQTESPINVLFGASSMDIVVHASSQNHLDDFRFGNDDYTLLSRDDNAIVAKKWSVDNDFQASINKTKLSTDETAPTEILLGNDQISTDITRTNAVITYSYKGSDGVSSDTFPTATGTYSVEVSYTAKYFDSRGRAYAYKGTQTFYFTLVKDQIASLSAPQNCTLEAYYDDADAVIAALPQAVTGVTESSQQEVSIPVVWTAPADYDSTPGAENSFTWTAQVPDTYDVPQTVATTGTITVTNKAYTPVVITGTNKTVVDNGAPIDVAALFHIDEHAGAAQYTIAGGTGTGTLNGTALTVTKVGTFQIRVTTEISGVYDAGSATAILRVTRSACDGSEHCPTYEYKDVLKDAWYHEDADFVVENGYMIGISTEPPVFAPEGNMTRAQTIQTLYQMEGRPAYTETADYPDVSEEQWFADAVNWGTEHGIIQGRDTGVFDPDANITREELVTILYRYAKEFKGLSVETEAGIPASFTDGDKVGDFAVDAFAWAIDQGIINGVTETTLEPQTLSRRCEMAKIIASFCAAYPEVP